MKVPRETPELIDAIEGAISEAQQGQLDHGVQARAVLAALADHPEPEGERDVRLTEDQIDLLLSITGPRVAQPDAERLGDWSVDLQARLEAARGD